MTPVRDHGTAGGGGDGGAVNEPRSRSFEEEFAAAEEAVELLERGDLTLEEALRRYEEGLRALGGCYAILERTRQRIEVLAGEVGCVEEGAAGPAWKPAAGFVSLREALDAVLKERATQAAFPPDARSTGAEGPS